MLTCQNFLNKKLFSEWWSRASGLEYLELFVLVPRAFKLLSSWESDRSQEYSRHNVFLLKLCHCTVSNLRCKGQNWNQGTELLVVLLDNITVPGEMEKLWFCFCSHDDFLVCWPWLEARHPPKPLCHSPEQLDRRDKI